MPQTGSAGHEATHPRLTLRAQPAPDARRDLEVAVAASNDSLERLRTAIDRLAAEDAAELLSEARSDARARVLAGLSDALASAIIDELHEHLALPAPDAPAVAKASPRGAARDRSASSRDQSAPPHDEYALYTYGVVTAGADVRPTPPGVTPDRPVTILTEGELAAIVSEVLAEEFDEARLHEQLADMGWVEATARAHEAVLEDVRRQTTVVPMRMCTVYSTEDSLRRMLRRESDPLLSALELLAGTAEWGVKVFAEFTGVGKGERAETGDRAGVAYMERIRTERELREAAMDAAEGAAAEIHERLSAIARDAHTIAPQRPEASGHAGDMILSGVYLVADDGMKAFHATTETLRSELDGCGIELVVTGPWPAYNFVPGAMESTW